MTRIPAGTERRGSVTKTPLGSKPAKSPEPSAGPVARSGLLSGGAWPAKGLPGLDQPLLLSLQRTAGNQAVASFLGRAPTVQRLMSGATLRAELGGPSSRSKTYRALIGDLDSYETSLQRPLTAGDTQGLLSDARRLDLLVRRVINTCELFLASHKRDARAARVSELKTEAASERAALRLLVAQIRGGTRPTWSNWKEGVESAGATSPRDLGAEGGVQIGEDSGGMNAVAKVRGGKIGGRSGRETGWQRRFEVFKPDKDKVDAQSMNEPFYAAGIGIPLGGGADIAEWRRYNAPDGGENDEKGPRFSARATASSRIDQLLNANVIAKTRLAVRHTPDGPVRGQIMAKAQGTNAGQVAKDVKEGNLPGFDIDDPDLQRMMSKLDLVDSLCGQIDRHGGNVFIDRDAKTGKVTSVTGIDNDMAFGTKGFTPGQTSREVAEYAGLGKYIDRETGDAILALTAEDLHAVLDDLLLSDEVDAAVERLDKLQELLRKAKEENRLIGPDQWSQQTTSGEATHKFGVRSAHGYHAHSFHLKGQGA